MAAVPAAPRFPRRAIHLDFHTSRDYATVATEFDADEFAETMAAAHVQAVNVFAKCVHGYSYYPTEVGTTHPGLSFDLLGAQIEALHRRGIRAPIYVSVLWDDLAAEQHPGWVVTDRDGRTLVRRPLSADTVLRNEVGYSSLDIATPYADYLLAQVEELCRRYPVDGLWFDLVWPEPSYSPAAQSRMRAAGVPLEDAEAVWEHYRDLLHDLCSRLRDVVTHHHPDATIFLNGSVGADMADIVELQTHIEVESLPTSGDVWGYSHYPVVARNARTHGKPLVGMTGRFHASWADFGGLKTVPQLEYEVGTIVGAGGAVCIGDQLHPDGRIDAAVYRTIGAVYERLARLEPFLDGAVPVREVAVLGHWERKSATGHLVAVHTDPVGAAVQLLLELGYQVDVVDPALTDLTGYRCVVVPDGSRLTASGEQALRGFHGAGGSVVVAGDACLTSDGSALSLLPLTYDAPTPTTPAYVRPTTAGTRGALATDFHYVLYDGAHVVRPDPGARTEGELHRATFDRRWDTFTSHGHAPVADALDAPMLVVGERVAYLAAPVFGSYGRHEYWVDRAFAQRALELTMGPPMLGRDGPAWLEATLHAQGPADGPDRYVVSMTAYQPRRSTSTVPRVDEGGLTAGVSVDLRPVEGFRPVRVTLEPEGDELAFEEVDGRWRVDLPPLRTHSVVVLHGS